MSRKPDNDAIPEATGISSPVPMSVEWKGAIENLLKLKEYDKSAMQEAGISTKNLPEDDLLVLLSAMPFEFRRPALYLHRAGYTVLGKIPIRLGKISQDGELVEPPRVTGNLRPMSCPEPPGPTEVFVIAWKEGNVWNWCLPYPRSGNSNQYAEDPGYLSYFRNLSVVRNPYNEELNAKEEMEFLENFFEDSLSHLMDFRDLWPEMKKFNAYDLDDLEDLMHKVHEHCYPDSDKSLLAFYAGFLYAREVSYPRCAELSSKNELASHGGWTSIISYAFLRHGKKTPRKELLKRLGCLNVEVFSKTSAEFLEFSWPYVPQTNGKRFDESYKQACRKSNNPTIFSKKSAGIIASQLASQAAFRERQRKARRSRKEESVANAKHVADSEQKQLVEDLKKNLNDLERQRKSQ